MYVFSYILLNIHAAPCKYYGPNLHVCHTGVYGAERRGKRVYGIDARYAFQQYIYIFLNRKYFNSTHTPYVLMPLFYRIGHLHHNGTDGT